MRGAPQGRGESEYLLGKYSGIAHFSVKSGQTPSDPAAPGVARIHRATSPINGGGKGLSTFCGNGHNCSLQKRPNGTKKVPERKFGDDFYGITDPFPS